MTDVPECQDCGAQMQFFDNGVRMLARCPWAMSARSRIEHDEPDMQVVYCGHPKIQDPHVVYATAKTP